MSAERAVQSDTGVVISMQREKSSRDRKAYEDDDDAVLFGREMKVTRVNLSRDHLAQRERESKKPEVEVVSVGSGVADAEDDAETVSDKTLVHQ